MLMKQEKILEYFDQLPMPIVRSAWIARCRAENDNLARLEEALVSDGFVRVEAEGPITEDGREVLHIRGRAYALRPDIHTARMTAKFELEEKRRAAKAVETETKSVVGTEALSAMLCPKCGDALQHTKVCPACPAGKIGYNHRYTCACGKVDMVSKEAL